MPSRRELLAMSSGAAVAAVTAGAAAPAQASPDHGQGWVATWAAAPTTVPPTPPTVLDNQTVRQVVHTSLGGDEIRLRLSNEFGETALHVGAVRVAVRAGTGASTATVPGTDRRVTFSGRGDVTAARTVTPSATIGQYLFLSGVAVRTRGSAVVTLGDSITNGANTEANQNHRWPDLFGARLRAAGLRRGVANVGISGNRLLHDPNPPAGSDAVSFANYFGVSGLRRFDRDVLAQPGRAYLVVLLGVNDLGHPGTVAPPSEVVTADDLIFGHRQLIRRAKETGVRAYAGTILPFKDDTLGFYTPENERKRSALNHWIRTSGEYDAVIDFDRAMRDPADALRLNPAYDSGDHLHPNDAGMAAMAAAVPLGLFR